LPGHKKGYPWPASALTVNEMAILAKWREKTGTPITELLKQVVVYVDGLIQQKEMKL
jgi:hypothetical protein